MLGQPPPDKHVYRQNPILADAKDEAFTSWPWPSSARASPESVIVVVEAAGDDGDRIGLDVVHEPVLLGYPA